jgi:hypothetical protein
MTTVITMGHENLQPVIKTAGASDSTSDFALLRNTTRYRGKFPGKGGVKASKM